MCFNYGDDEAVPPPLFFLSTTTEDDNLPLTQQNSTSNNCSNASFHTSAHISSCVLANLQILTRSVRSSVCVSLCYSG